MSPEGRDPAGAAAPPLHRGRPADPRGAQLLAPGQPVHAAPAGGVGRPPRGLGDPRGRRRPARLPAGRLVRPRGAADRRDRVRAWARRPASSPPPARRTTCWRWRSGGPASPRRWPRWRRPARPTCGSAPSTRCGRSSTWSTPDGLAELWTFFPDPWPKTRHHKRRLVDARVRRAGGRAGSRPGGRWRLATDWADYAEQMVAVLDAEPRLTGGVVPRWDERPVTKFERKGVEAGRVITDLCYRPAPRPGLSRGRRRPRSSSCSVRSRSLSRSSASVIRSSSVGTSRARHASSSASSYAATIARRRAIGVPVAGVQRLRPDPAQVGGDPLDRHPGRHRRQSVGSRSQSGRTRHAERRGRRRRARSATDALATPDGDQGENDARPTPASGMSRR